MHFFYSYMCIIAGFCSFCFFFSRLGANQPCGTAKKMSVGKYYGQNKMALAVALTTRI